MSAGVYQKSIWNLWKNLVILLNFLPKLTHFLQRHTSLIKTKLWKEKAWIHRAHETKGKLFIATNNLCHISINVTENIPLTHPFTNTSRIKVSVELTFLTFKEMLINYIPTRGYQYYSKLYSWIFVPYFLNQVQRASLDTRKKFKIFRYIWTK